ncbi:MAG: ubiquinol-cytochrome c reductase iron-sulfur subunit [Byssovorax sp.]
MATSKKDGAPESAAPAESPAEPERRTFLGTTTSLAMTAGLVGSYGALGALSVRYLYPAKPTPKAWMYVADLASFHAGKSLVYKTPSGARVVIARNGSAGTEADFIALSSTCPHLGCNVHWEGDKQRFFCPCHNGTFDPSGKATGGPPGDAGQSLPRYPLKVDKGLLYIEVAVDVPV